MAMYSGTDLQPSGGDHQEESLRKINQLLYEDSSAGGGGDATAANQATQIALQTSTTQVSAAKTAGQSVTIPIGAKEWTVTIWTGTATVNGAAGCPAGFRDASDKKISESITITFDTPGTGYVRYST